MDVCSSPPSTTWQPTKRHFSTDDEFFREGDQVCFHSEQCIAESDDDISVPNLPEFVCNHSGCKEVFESLASYESHYHQKHTHRCSQCKRPFPSDHLLDIHIHEAHNPLFHLAAESTPSYKCLVKGCLMSFLQPEERREHLITIHKYPASFRFNRIRRQNKKTHISSNGVRSEAMDVDGTPSNDSSANAGCQVKRIFSHSVPSHISFGSGAHKTFQRKKCPRSKHNQRIVQTENPAASCPPSMDMADLYTALPVTNQT